MPRRSCLFLYQSKRGMRGWTAPLASAQAAALVAQVTPFTLRKPGAVAVPVCQRTVLVPSSSRSRLE
jgi:hypothetical protein